MLEQPSPQPIIVSPLVEHLLEEQLPDWGFVSVSLGFDGALYLLIISPKSAFQPKKRYYGHFEIYTKNITELHDYCILRYTDHVTHRWTILNQPMFYTFAQPLPDDEMLLVCPRARLYAPNLFHLNAAVFTSVGALRCRFLVGDGIASVQTTSDGRIWTSYLDEGIYGNYGWGSSGIVSSKEYTYVEPIGVDGLQLWDSAGRTLYRYQPEEPPELMADCYALNVVSDDTVLLYYYTDFPLVCLHNERITSVWYPPIQMVKAFAIWQRWVVFIAEPKEEGIQLSLCELGENAAINLVGSYTPSTPSGEPLQGWLSARGDTCVVLDAEGTLYRLSVETLVAQLPVA